MLLTETASCPVCGTSREHSRTNAEAFDFAQGLDYLAPLLDAESDESKVELDNMQSYECAVCGAVYLDPWLSRTGRARVFISGHPIHNVGWRTYLERIERNLTPALQIEPTELLEHIQRETGELTNYFEMGCPFQGLLVHFSERRKLEEYRGTSAKISGMFPRHSRRFLLPLRIFLRIASLGRNIALQVSRARTVRDRLRGRHQPEPALSKCDSSKIKKYFVPLESSKFWGSNCSVFGESCAATAMGALDATVVSRYEFEQMGKIPNSCVGLFNVLDHQDDPLGLIRSCLQQATVVVVLGHEPPLGIQHHFGLGSGFFDRLPDFIPRLQVTRLNDSGENSLLYLLSCKS